MKFSTIFKHAAKGTRFEIQKSVVKDEEETIERVCDLDKACRVPAEIYKSDVEVIIAAGADKLMIILEKDRQERS